MKLTLGSVVGASIIGAPFVTGMASAEGVIGSWILWTLPVLGGEMMAVTAGSLGGLALALAAGAAILAIPYVLLVLLLQHFVNAKQHPFATFCLQAVLAIGMTCAAAAISAAIMGVAFYPLIFCALAGGIAISTILIGVGVVASIIMGVGDREENSPLNSSQVVSSPGR